MSDRSIDFDLLIDKSIDFHLQFIMFDIDWFSLIWKQCSLTNFNNNFCRRLVPENIFAATIQEVETVFEANNGTEQYKRKLVYHDNPNVLGIDFLYLVNP